MSLAAGTRLGPYVIESPLGAGGMGEVYKARDSRLDRTVALKVLRTGMAATPEAKARLEREARAISQLQHPHICTLFDIGKDQGTDYLVMEYLEGETLAARLAKGALQPADFFRISAEAASALEQAHRAGIVHRDLKPGNIMLTKGGAKLLDFGLAKPAGLAAGVASTSPSLAEAATLTSPSPMDSPLTRQGALIGTVQYMSPEQIKGLPAETRSDIFAFGVVLYEMAAGQRPFSGKSQLRVASSILEDEPAPPSQLRPELPRGIDHLILGCLAKEPDARYASVHDVALELSWLAAAAPSKAVPDERRGLPLWAWIGFAVVLALGVAVGIFLRRPRRAASYEATLLPPDQTSFLTGGIGSAPVLSPDGTRIGFIAAAGASQQLYVRALDSLSAQPLAGTAGATQPFWSPDSRNLGFFANGELERVDDSGGPIQVLAPAPYPRGGSWSPNGTILFTPSITTPLMRISASGGAAVPVTRLATNDRSHRWPDFLPDGKHFLFLSIPGRICLGVLGSDGHNVLLNNASNAIYASGNLLYVSDNTLVAQPFNLRTLAAGGEPVPLAQGVSVEANVQRGMFSGSARGQLAYQSGNGGGGLALDWVNANGKATGSLPGSANYLRPAISPDGSKLAADVSSNLHADIWIFDLRRGTRSRFTVSGAGSGALAPVWTPDGRNIIYTEITTGQGASIYIKPADDSGPARLLERNGFRHYAKSVSAKGDLLAIVRGAGIWALPLTGGTKPFPVLQCTTGCVQPALSPDGRWLAYVSAESGSEQVYVTSFPKSGPRWPVSTQGGGWPHWGPEGKNLFYEQDFHSIESVAIAANGNGLTLGGVQTLFSVNMARVPSPFDTRDGKRFLVVVPAGAQASVELNLITNWPSRLKP